MIHELKILPEFFEDVISGRKSFEVRKFDRPYHVGDLLALNEYDGKNRCYTGRSCLVYIDYMLTDGKYCKPGMVIMAIKPCIVYKFDSPHCSPILNRNDYSVPLATDATYNEVEE